MASSTGPVTSFDSTGKAAEIGIESAATQKAPGNLMSVLKAKGSTEITSLSSVSDSACALGVPLTLVCKTTCPPSQSNFWVGVERNDLSIEEYGPIRAPKTISLSDCSSMRRVAFECNDVILGPYMVNVCYAEITVCDCSRICVDNCNKEK